MTDYEPDQYWLGINADELRRLADALDAYAPGSSVSELIEQWRVRGHAVEQADTDPVQAAVRAEATALESGRYKVPVAMVLARLLDDPKLGHYHAGAAAELVSLLAPERPDNPEGGPDESPPHLRLVDD